MALWLRLVLVAAVVALAGYAVHSYNGWQRGIGASAQKQVDQTATDKLKRDAAQELAVETAKTAAAQTRLEESLAKQGVKDVQNLKTVSVLADKLRKLTVDGRLRDPYAKACGSGSGDSSTESKSATSAGDSFGNRTIASGFLSPELTGFLQSKDDSADAINIAYIACRADAIEIRKALNPP